MMDVTPMPQKINHLLTLSILGDPSKNIDSDMIDIIGNIKTNNAFEKM